jgi:hypothetical protein
MGARKLIALILGVAACAGPRPMVDTQGIALTPGKSGYERVTIELHNANGGHGQIDVEITLHGQSGRLIREIRTIELRAHEHLQVVADIAAPEDIYVASIETKYPR